MATRAGQALQYALIKEYTVGTAATKGKLAKFGSDDETMTDASAGENGLAVWLETGTTGQRKEAVLLAGGAIVKVLVGTGGATRGSYAVAVSDGFTNKTLGGGTTVSYIAGKFLQTAVAGDYAELLVGEFASVSS